MPNSSKPYAARNFILHLFDGALYMGGLAFVSPEIVLSVLIYRLGGSEIAIGGIFALTEMGGALPQILTAPFIDGMARKKLCVLIVAFIQRLPWLIVGLLLLFGKIAGVGGVSIVLGLIVTGALIGGTMGPAWSSFLASTVPETRRGRLFALRQSFAGVIGIGAGFLTAYLLNTVHFPVNFSLLFFTCYGFYLASFICLIFVHEPRRPVRSHESLQSYYFKHIPRILKNDKDFRWFLFMKAGMLLSLISFGFYSVYGITRFSLPPSTAGVFTSCYMAGQISCSFLFGWIADRYGHRVNMILFGVIVIIQNLMAVLAPHPSIFYLLFILLGANRSIQIITFITMPLEYTGSRDRPTYFALSYTLTAPFFLSGMLGGGLIPFIGYEGIFFLSAFFAVWVMFCAFRFIREPRFHRLKG